MFEVAESDRLTRTVRELMRPIRFVPETKPVHDLMREMQQEGAHMVIVVDEYGNTAGLATMEDLVEVILGEIRDEHEPDFRCDGRWQRRLYRLRQFRTSPVSPICSNFKPDEDIESTTIGGLMTEWLGRVPNRRSDRARRHPGGSPGQRRYAGRTGAHLSQATVAAKQVKHD